MRKLSVTVIAVGLVLFLSCRTGDTGTPLGDTYARIARPVIWKVLPRSQAEKLELEPGDVIFTYNGVAVTTNQDLLDLMAQVTDSAASVPLVVLRGDEEISLEVRPGPLGFVPDSDRYPSSLAIALEDIVSHLGMEADYDWLAAQTAEAFTFTAHRDRCPMTWPGGLSATYLDDVAFGAGVTLQLLYELPEDDSAEADADAEERPAGGIGMVLERGRIVLVHGGWDEPYGEEWGVATRYDRDDSLLYGYVAGSADEQPITGRIIEAHAVRRSGSGGEDLEELLHNVLVQALELGQAYADTGWQSGVVAYDEWVGLLDTIPFCPRCSTSSQACFDRLVWALRANKESANRFMEDMRIALPDQIGLIDELIAYNNAVIGKLDGIIQSGARVGKLEDQRKLALAIGEIELLEVELLEVYEDLLGEL